MKYQVTLFLVFFAVGLMAQNPIDVNDEAGVQEVHRILVEKGQTLLDYKDFMAAEEIQTDINPGEDPEGDYMFRPAFTTDGSKVLVPNGGTGTPQEIRFTAS